MGNILNPHNSGGGGPETGTLIQCVNSRDPQIHKLCFWVIDRIYHEVQLTARVKIPSGTVGEFVPDYISENGRRNKVIGKISINGSVQFIGLSQI